MSISVTERKTLFRRFSGFTAGAVFSGVFAFVYSLFSHEVYSAYITYAFAVPLTAAILTLLSLIPKIKMIPRLTFNLFSATVATLTAGFIVRGVFEIAGNGSKAYIIYTVISVILMVLTVISCFVKSKTKK